MPNVLVAIVSCHKRRAWVSAQRQTWIPSLKCDYRVFIGRPDNKLHADEVMLDVDDSYECLPAKVKAVAGWALTHDYDFLLKLDDDTYLYPDRFLASGFERHDYTGAAGGGLNDFASGGAYVLSARAMMAVSDYPLVPTLKSEDRWVSQAIMNSTGCKGGKGSNPGMTFDSDKRYMFLTVQPRIAVKSGAPPNAIAVCEFAPDDMITFHNCKKWKRPIVYSKGH